MDLNGKCVLLGVSGGIAAYKMANVASALRKLGADVEVIMTKNATQFITPLTFETLTGTVTSIDSDVTASSNASYYKMTIKPDATYVVSRSGDKVDLANGMSVTARVEYDQVTYFEYAMEALGVLFR